MPVDLMVNKFNDIINTVINDNVPVTKARKTKFPHWFNKSTISVINEKLKMHKK